MNAAVHHAGEKLLSQMQFRTMICGLRGEQTRSCGEEEGKLTMAITSQAKSAEHPSGDERFKALDRAMKCFDYEKDALLKVLNAAQGTFGCL